MTSAVIGMVVAVAAMVVSMTASAFSWRQQRTSKEKTDALLSRISELEDTLARVRLAVYIADTEDVTEWQRGFRSCAKRVQDMLDQATDTITDQEATAP
jgi:phosphate uptake regulator